jgi:quinol monooxygenase YgiN
MSEIALLCLIHPKDPAAKSRVQSLIHQHYPYNHSPTPDCKAWVTYSPSLRKNAPALQVPAETKHLVIGIFELYPSESAMATQIEQPGWNAYHETVKAENLYSKPEDIVPWTPRGGYFHRAAGTPAGKGVVVMTATFKCKSPEAAERVVARLSTYAAWVKENEGEVLTYAVLSREKAPTEVLMFERYANRGAIRAHGSSKEFKGMFRDIKGELAGTTMNEWEEEGGFVGSGVKAKL